MTTASKTAGRLSNASFDVKELESLVDIENGLIDRRIFWDEAIYQRELEKIFARCWLFVAHESQIAQIDPIQTEDRSPRSRATS